jgi:predicted DsbA family dithiol-disulfide isomerase
VAAGVGLAAAILREALLGGRYAAEVREQMDWTRAAGVTGVPTVIYNEKFAVVGAQDYAVYRDVAARVAAGRLVSDNALS